ncbi:MAG: glycosyltransferase [bacterium]
MKIALFGPTYPFRGGIAHYTTILARQLKARHEVRLFGFKRFYPHWLHPAKTDRDQSQFLLKEDDTRLILDSVNPFTWVKLAKEIAAFEPDLVILSWWISFWAPHYYTVVKQIRRRVDTRVLFICHNVIDHESFVLGRRLTESVLKLGDLFLVHSQEDFDNLKGIFPDATVQKVFHPNYLIFQRKSLSREEARKELGLNQDTILFFGFVRPYKGLALLLEALPGVLEKRQVQLVVAGEFWKDKAFYLKKIKSLRIEKNVQIVDRYIANEEIATYFKATDLLVMPYTSATGSGVVQLAFAFDLPAIVTNVGALPEVVLHGQTGYVVPKQDAQALAEHIVKFFEEKRWSEFRENIKRDKQRFSWDNLVQTIETLYQT